MTRRIRVLVGLLALTSTWVAVAGAAGPSPSLVVTTLPTHRRVVALTFDDGPGQYTPAVLSILRQFNIHATFFLVGIHATERRDLVEAEKRAGHIVGNHTFLHSNSVWLSTAALAQQLVATQQVIQQATHTTPHWFRPPYGAVDARVALVARSLGLYTVTWSVDPRDWSLPGTAWIVTRVLLAARPGSIILLHDGGGNRSETVAALPAIITALRREGYDFVTLDQIFFPEANARPGKHPNTPSR